MLNSQPLGTYPVTPFTDEPSPRSSGSPAPRSGPLQTVVERLALGLAPPAPTLVASERALLGKSVSAARGW